MFWEQMRNEIANKEKESANVGDPIPNQDSKEESKPQVKPRTKLIMPTTETSIKQQPIITILKKETLQKVFKNEATQENQRILNKNMEDLPKQHDSVLESQGPKTLQDDSLSETESEKNSIIRKHQIITPKENSLHKSPKR